MSAPHRTVKRRDTNLEKLYAQYQPVATKAKRETATEPVAAVSVLTPAEAAFVRRDLGRVILAALLTLIAIIVVWLTSGQSYWTNFINWLAQLTHF